MIDEKNTSVYNFSAKRLIGEVLELADRRDLGSRAARREGSSPSFPTNKNTVFSWQTFTIRRQYFYLILTIACYNPARY
jgi:hypothetical protein